MQRCAVSETMYWHSSDFAPSMHCADALKSMLRWRALTSDMVLVCYQTSPSPLASCLTSGDIWHYDSSARRRLKNAISWTPDSNSNSNSPTQMHSLSSLGTLGVGAVKSLALSAQRKLKCYLCWWICTLAQRPAAHPGRKCGSQDIPLRAVCLGCDWNWFTSCVHEIAQFMRPIRAIIKATK